MELAPSTSLLGLHLPTQYSEAEKTKVTKERDGKGRGNKI